MFRTLLCPYLLSGITIVTLFFYFQNTKHCITSLNLSIYEKIILLLLVFSSLTQLSAQKSDYKYGKISDEELNMTSYDKDTSAKAVILYEDVEIKYDFSSSTQIVYDYKTRIKILSAEGASYADISIPVYSMGNKGKEQ